MKKKYEASRELSKKYPFLQGLTDEEIADAYIFPHGLTDEEKAAADRELSAYIKEKRSKMTWEDHLMSRLLQIKFQMEDAVAADKFLDKLNFGYFLSMYIQAIQKKQKEFAQEISLDETRLSRLIHRKEWPNEELFIRLELHSNNMIPAMHWFKLVEKEKAHNISANTELRKKQKKFVRKTLGLTG
ncbi:hypothetical protein [Chitinophaga sp. HK235]|uniref:hypothetical protein n=1 Tax=Chitinophaga sp. HK235 TaxID=2952571 RepID=UPI001BA65C4A|nr:hypothetical protein [Chitinophaga sp. HK235]